MLSFLVLVAAFFWVAVYLVFFRANDIQISHLLRGEHELPEIEWGTWVVSQEREGRGRVREERYLEEEGSLFRSSRIIQQVRYRDAVGGEIIEILPETVVSGRTLRIRCIQSAQRSEGSGKDGEVLSESRK